MKIVIFGASVSEQTIKHDDNTITGYVNHLEHNSKVLGLNYDISRITAGSCSIHDAGIALVDDVVNLNPDICILDWCTAGDTKCSYEVVTAIYNRLTSNNILPINLVLPRKDREQTETDLYQHIKYLTQKYSLPFWDLSKEIDKALLDIFLRDVVHTNKAGAQYYSEFLIYQLMYLEKKYIPVVESSHKLIRKTYNFDQHKNKAHSINIDLFTVSSFLNNNVYIFLEQRVGPWSRTLKCNLVPNQGENKRLQNVVLHDPWSWRERQCIKPIAPYIKIEDDIDSFTLEISANDNDPSCIKYGIDKVDYKSYQAEIRPKGRLIILSDNNAYEINKVYVK